MMKTPRLSIKLGLLFLIVVGCQGQPSEMDGERLLRQHIDNGEATRLRLVDFTKTDGQAGDVFGVRAYSMPFEALAEFKTASSYDVCGMMCDRRTVTTREYMPPRPGFSSDDVFASTRGLRPAVKGDRLRLTGEITFEEMESGWKGTIRELHYTHDSTLREATVTESETTPAHAIAGPWTNGGQHCLIVADRPGNSYLLQFVSYGTSALAAQYCGLPDGPGFRTPVVMVHWFGDRFEDNLGTTRLNVLGDTLEVLLASGGRPIDWMFGDSAENSRLRARGERARNFFTKISR